MSDRWRQIESLFHRAVDLPASERVVFLDGACNGDTALRRELDALLTLEPAAESFLEESAAEVFGAEQADQHGQASPDALVGRKIGAYTLLRVIGAGGMGVVYLARQAAPQRLVALKLMRAAIASDSGLRRFRRESGILARLQHPGIAKVFEAGIHDAEGLALPYMALEYVPGARTLTDHARQAELDLRARLVLFARVCDALDHAHRCGVIHRDIKPANILVASDGIPRIIDFGVARGVGSAEGQTTFSTRSGQVIGTLQYMSPEQARGVSTEIDVRSDIYALGIVLHELVTAELPYDVSALPLPEAIRVICEHSSSAALGRSALVPVDVSTIVRKALAKEARRRYQSAAELAEDIRRYLANEPISARAPSATYQLHKLIVRHRVTFGLSAAIFVLTLTFSIVATIQATRIARERDRVMAERQHAVQVNAFLQELLAAPDPWRLGPDVTVREILADAAARVDVEFAEQPLTAAALHRSLGAAYRGLGLYDRSAAQIRAAHDLLEQAAAVDRMDLADVHVDLAGVLRKSGDVAGARALLAPALEDMQRWAPADDSVLLRAREELALIHAAEGDYPTARGLFQNTIHRRRAAAKQRPLSLAAALQDFGGVLKDTGALNDAEQAYREALAAYRGAWGDEHPDVASCLNDLGSVLEDRGMITEAEATYREALAISRAVLGERHPLIAITENNLASALHESGAYDEAESLYEDALTIYEDMLGAEHPEVLVTLTNLAELDRARGRYAEAEDRFREVLRIRRVKLGDKHPDVARSLNNLAATLKTRGDLAAAEPLLREAIAIFRSVFGEAHPELAVTMGNLASLLRARGSMDEAEQLLQDELRMQRRLLGDAHPDVATTWNNLAGLALARGETDAAEKYFQDALTIFEGQPGEPAPNVNVVRSNLAALRFRRGQYAAAEPLFREALDAYSALLGADHPGVVTMQCNLGATLHALDRLDEASALLRAALDVRREQLGVDHIDVAHAEHLLGAVLFDAGSTADATPLLCSAVEIRRRELPSGHVLTALSESYLAACLVDAGECERAQALLRASEPVLSVGFKENGAGWPAIAARFARVRTACSELRDAP